MQTIKILVVDDNAGFRRRITGFLDTVGDLEVVGEAADGVEALLKAGELNPDIIIMDVRMPGTNGISVTREIREHVSSVKVIILSRFDLQEYRYAAMASGASGYVLKRSMTEDLVPAIRTALDPSSECAR